MKQQQEDIVVVFQGVSGAYSEQAVFELLGTTGVKAVGQDSFEKCFQAVNDGKANFALLPIENSQGGSIHANFDLQLRYNHFIVAEYDFRVCHCLMALPGVRKEDITKVWSHPQALAQCDDYTHRNNYIAEATNDTAQSAKMIAEQQVNNVGAIASRLAAEHYGLQILDEGIEDNKNNFTRFLLLSKKFLPITLSRRCPSVPMKTSLVFSLINEPGALVKALSAFSFRNVDFMKLESRPDKLQLRGRDVFLSNSKTEEEFHFSAEDMEVLARLKLPVEMESYLQGDSEEVNPRFRFIFYLDCAGSLTDMKLQNALRQLSEISPYLRILGSYPRSGVLCDFVAESVHIPCGMTMQQQLAEKLEKRPRTTSGSAIPEGPLKIGIVGFGNFGQFLAVKFAKNHKVYACSRSDYSEVSKKIGVTFTDTVENMFRVSGGLDCLVISVSILSFESILRKIPVHLLHNVLVVDVLSVKILPKNAMQIVLPQTVDILCTHPMFGPESGKYSWRGLPFVYEKVRIGQCPDLDMSASERRCDKFLNIFREAGCRMVEMSCEMHDEAAAGSQFVTHFTGRLLSHLNLHSTPINTKGFETLLTLVDNTCKDSFDLFSALYLCNPNSSSQLDALQEAMVSLTDKLHQSRLSHDGANAAPRNLSKLVSRISSSKTSAVHGRALELVRQGKDVITTLTVGEPDFKPPQPILDAVTYGAEHGQTKYTAVQGTFELRDAICKDYIRRKNVTYDPNSEVVVTHGGKQAIFLAVLALVEKGDEVVIPAPYWVSYPDIVRIADGTPVFVERQPENGFIMTAEQLERALSPRTRMLILCNPCNPCGCVYTKQQLEDLAAVLRKPEYSNVIVMADEIYERLTYDNIEHVSFAAIDGMKERTLIVNGFAKNFAMTGFRLGYLASSMKHVIGAATKLQSQLNSCPCSLSQYAATAGLTKVPEEMLQPLYAELEKKRNIIIEMLQEIPHVLCRKATGAFYAFPDVSYYLNKGGRSPTTGFVVNDSTDLCKYLIEEHGVALPPGDAFGGPYGVRFSYAASVDDIKEGVKRFRRGLESLQFPN